MKKSGFLRFLFVTGLLCLGGCSMFYPTPPMHLPLDGFPLRRFDRVTASVYRSGQPSKDDLRELKTRYGIRSVLKLNHGTDDIPSGVVVLHHPLDVLREPNTEKLDAILEAIEKSPKPVLIHCTHGEDRTGLIVAFYKMRHGESADSAYADMIRHGFHPFPGIFQAWMRKAGWLD